MRSPLGRAIGLGSAKEGVEHWWAQRVTAIALVPLSETVLAFWLVPKFTPVIVISEPTGPEVGEIPEIISGPCARACSHNTLARNKTVKIANPHRSKIAYRRAVKKIFA